MYTYQDLYKSLQHNARYGHKTLKLMHNTRARFEATENAGAVIVVKYHDTDIVYLYDDDSLIFTTGGWFTSTTKLRINDFMPVGWRVYQSRGVWYVWNYKTDTEHVFKDGCQYNPAVGWLGVGSVEDAKKLRELDNRIKRYVKDYIEALFNGEVPRPDAGDCFYCHMRDVESGRPLGDVVKDTSHLTYHFEEKYYVPSLLYNAIDCESYISPMSSHILHSLWYDENPDVGWGADIAREQLGKILLKYLRQRFDIAR